MSGLDVVCGKLRYWNITKFPRHVKNTVKLLITDVLIGNEGNVIMATYGKDKCRLSCDRAAVTRHTTTPCLFSFEI